MKFLARSVYFSFPKYADFIIFDETNSNIISQVIPETYSSSIFRTRPVHLAINFEVIFYFLKYLKDLRIFKKFASNKSFIRNILWQLLCIYIKSYIYTVKPKAVITSIDNCTKFAWLSKNISEIPFIAVQNGFRLSYDVDSKSIYHCQHLFCFGYFEIEKFPSRNWNVDNFYPVGSLNASLHFKQEKVTDSNEYDILVVSSWRGNIGFQKDVEDSMKAMKLFDNEFSEYLSKRNIKAAVILRSERDSDQWYMPEIGMNEEEYFRSIYKDSIEIIDTNFLSRNVYSLIEKSEIIICSFCSTVLIEAFGIGKKILYCDYTNDKKYFEDFTKEIKFKKDSKFSSTSLDLKLDALFEIQNHEYRKCYNSLMNYYQTINYETTLVDSVKTQIKEIIQIKTSE